MAHENNPKASLIGFVHEQAFAPFVPGHHHIPDYYRATRSTEHVKAGADIIELVEAWDVQRPCIAWAIKYLIRSGRKPGEDAAKDLTKACEVIQRELSAVVRAPQGRDCES